MQAAIIGRTYLLRANRAKWHYIPPEFDLTFITPASKQHVLHLYTVEKSQRWPHYVLPAYQTDTMSGFYFSPFPLWNALRRTKPQLIQIDEEPSSLAMLEVLLGKRLLKYRLIFFTWENMAMRYRKPFSWIRRLTLKLADGAIAGNQEGADLLRQAGFQKPVAVIPQLGINPDHFQQQRHEALRESLGLRSFTIGYIGRLVPEKGLLILLEALSKLTVAWQWLIVGRGPLKNDLVNEAQRRGLAERIVWVDTVPHPEIPLYLNAMDVFVLPSQSTPHWQEQFGHVLIEAMACGVPVVGSVSGAIPTVIDQAGFVFPEEDAQKLSQQLQQLAEDVALRGRLAQLGRERVLKHYTDQQIVAQTISFWRSVMACA